MTGPATGYEAVYALEVTLLFATLIILGPLVRFAPAEPGLVRAAMPIEGIR